MKSLVNLFMNCAYDIAYTELSEDVSYATVREGDTLYIYFEGSATKKDWKHNFMFRKKPYKNMDTTFYCHRGFLKCWKVVNDKIIEVIADPTIKEIITIGYSHGGALAALCHECVWFHRPDIRNNIWGIGFEAPRVYASYHVRKSLQPRWEHFMVTQNTKDIVPHMPPKIFGFSHVGKKLKLNGGGGYITAHFQGPVSNGLALSEYNYDWKKFFDK